jgi:hypothetical protein
MPPVVYTRHQETKKKQSQNPPTNLPVDGMAVCTPSTFAIVQTGPNQAADSSRGPEGKAYPGKV